METTTKRADFNLFLQGKATHEKRVGEHSKKIKIPNICEQWGHRNSWKTATKELTDAGKKK